MNDILKKIQVLVASDDVRISEHSYDSMLDDGLYTREIVAGVHIKGRESRDSSS